MWQGHFWGGHWDPMKIVLGPRIDHIFVNFITKTFLKTSGIYWINFWYKRGPDNPYIRMQWPPSFADKAPVREDIHPKPAAVRRDIHHLCQTNLEHGSCLKKDCTISFVWFVIFCTINIAISGKIMCQCWGKHMKTMYHHNHHHYHFCYPYAGHLMNKHG